MPPKRAYQRRNPTRGTGPLGLFDVNHSNADLMRRNGHVAYWATGPNRKGIKLDYDLSRDIGTQVIGDLSYFYVVSTDCGCVDPIKANTPRGKLKIGISNAKAMNFTYRLQHYQAMWGDSCYLHGLILFKTKAQANAFEAAVKRDTLNIPENGANIRNGAPIPGAKVKVHERFSLEDIVAVMDTVDTLRQQPYWQAHTGAPRRGVVRRVRL